MAMRPQVLKDRLELLHRQCGALAAELKPYARQWPAEARASGIPHTTPLQWFVDYFNIAIAYARDAADKAAERVPKAMGQAISDKFAARWKEFYNLRVALDESALCGEMTRDTQLHFNALLADLEQQTQYLLNDLGKSRTPRVHRV